MAESWWSRMVGRSSGEAGDGVPEPPSWLPYAVLFVDAQGQVVGANDAACTLFGEPVGKSLDAMLPDADHLDDLPTEKITGSGGVLGTFWRVEALRTDGRPISVEVSCGPAPFEGGTAWTFAPDERHQKVISRLTAANQRLSASRDEAIDQSRAKTVMLARLAQVIRTPLSAIIGYGEIIGEEVEDRALEGLSEDIGRILRSASTVLDVLRNVVDLAEIEAGRMSVLKRAFPIEDVLEGEVERIRPFVEAKGLELRVQLEDMGEALADPERVKQVLHNLARNAVDYTDSGTISLTARRIANDFVITIEDPGEGMTPEQIEEVLVSYGRRSSARHSGGAGVSLFVSHALIDLMGGKLHIESQPGKGTKLRLVLPAVPVHIAPPMMSAPERVSQDAVRVSIVDDALREQVMSSLARGNWNCVSMTVDDTHVHAPIVTDQPGSVPAAQSALAAVVGRTRKQVGYGPSTCIIPADADEYRVDELLHSAVTRAVIASRMRA